MTGLNLATTSHVGVQTASTAETAPNQEDAASRVQTEGGVVTVGSTDVQQREAVVVQSTFTFKDGCVITIRSEDATVKEGGEEILCNDKDKPVFTNDNGEAVVEYSGIPTDKRTDRSWAKATFAPNGASTPHYHKKGVEDYYITKGEALVTLDGVEHRLKAGDHITVPVGVMHPVTNLSDDYDLELYVKCTPSWVFEDFHLPENES